MINIKSLIWVKNWHCARKQFDKKLGIIHGTTYLCIVIQHES